MPESRSGRALVLGALLLVAVTPAVGCKFFKGKQRQQRAAVKFNEQLVAHNKSIHRLAVALGQKIHLRLSGKGRVDDEDLDEAVEAIQARVKKVRAAVSKMYIPSHPTAVALHKAYLKFLKEEEAIIERLQDVVEVVTTPDPRKRRQQRKLMEIIREIQRDEKKSLRRLQKVQRHFARAHNISLRF